MVTLPYDFCETCTARILTADAVYVVGLPYCAAHAPVRALMRQRLLGTDASRTYTYVVALAHMQHTKHTYYRGCGYYAAGLAIAALGNIELVIAEAREVALGVQP